MRRVVKVCVLIAVAGLLGGPALGVEEKAAEKPAAKAVKKAPQEQKPEKKSATVVDFTLRGEYPEGPAPAQLFGDMQTSLRTIVDRLDSAATDPDVRAVLLRIEPQLQIGRAKVFEFRAAIGRVRKAGKPVMALLASAEASHYLVAAACDQVIMVPSGVLMLPGVRAEMTFFKGLLDKLGLQFEMLQQGKYKGAGEPMTRTSMSAPLRESMEAVVDDTYERLAETVAKDRRMEDYRVKTLIDEGLFTAQGALAAGLVDHLLYADQVEDRFRSALKVDEVKLNAKYKRKKVDTDFSGLSGMMKLLEMMFGGKKAEAPTAAKKIALVYAVGPIVEGKSKNELFGSSVVGSANLTAALRKAADDKSVVAVVLRIDSPGGSAVASDLIWREVVRMRKPVIASMGDVAGSGGYYIAMGADKIVAAPGTLTGSIGVIGGKLVMGKALGKIGITTDVISRGKNAGSMSPLAPFSESERKAWTRLMEDIYRQFVSKAAQGRKMAFKDMDKVAQGRIYTGAMAVGLHLVDGLGSLDDAVAEAKKAAKLKADEKVEIMILPQPLSIFEQLFGDQATTGDLSEFAPGVLGKTLRQAALFERLLAEPVLTLMPMRVDLK